MSVTLDTTVGGATANSFASLAEAEAYVLTAVFTTPWSGKTDDQKKAALITATRRLQSLGWLGIRAASAQTLAWPRYGVVDGDGYLVDSTTIPQRVKDAQCELAIRELGEDRANDPAAGAPQRVKVGPLEVDYGSAARRTPPPVTSAVAGMLSDLLDGMPGDSIYLVRG